MKKYLIHAALIVMTSVLSAQYYPQVSHFMYNNLQTNPGSAGSMDMVCASMIYRDQMAGFEGAPKSWFLNIETPFKLFGTQHGAGITIYSDEIGFFTDINFALSYAYRISVGEGTLGIGVQGGFADKKIDPEWRFPGGASNSSDYDGKIPYGNADEMSFNLSAGLFYRTEDIYFGASAVNLTDPDIKAPGSTDGNVDANYNLGRMFYVTAGYNMQLNNPVWEIKPAVLLKSDGIATDLDLNLVLAYNKKIWGGVTYRTSEAAVAMVGFELLEGLKVGFAYDFMTSALSTKTQTYEVMLNYCFKIGVEKAPQKYKSIRFL